MGDVVGVAQCDESTTGAAESGDVVSAVSAQKGFAGVEPTVIASRVIVYLLSRTGAYPIRRSAAGRHWLN
ncbi:MAG: hypothetical protein ACXWEI_23290 [Mycobacterium sp.]